MIAENKTKPQEKGAPNENNSYSTDEVKRLRWLVDDEGGLVEDRRKDKRRRRK